ncbi:neuronal acetylcholine receptor subunit alpha-5-like isoform X2 [Schistocerca piceifrons]|uniref:neuronal acetylcholine receptor subunit alpha-5-like isoform X2 n=1 Tax=Schistocerca piceifrons TaxID=274613 RepID=UPI001F5E7E6F|nr:neuronal acetylcholine receptor subunit alpha-5-like isoform X2 [Schistocerca piceifrons]
MGCLKCCLALLFVVLACVFASSSPEIPNTDDTKPLWNATWTDKLKRKLLTHYDKFSRPAQHTNATVVKMVLTFRHIELDELKSVMTVYGWMRMQDGAPPHFHHEVRGYLNMELLHRRIGHATEGDSCFMKWPPRAPDLAPCDFFLWEHIKDLVDVPPLPCDIADLWERIREVTATLDDAMLGRIWTDEKLKWNKTEWGGLHELHLADHEIWQPDIILYNSASGSSIDHYGNSHCVVFPTGEVIWVPPAQFLVFCDLDLRLWPYDTQICHLTLGSWTYDGDQVDLQLGVPFDGFEMDLWNTNSEWQIVDVKGNRAEQYYSCCTEPYIDITYNITLRRQSPAYSAIVITPAAAIVLMTLAGFWLPPNAGEKILLNGCTAIIICLFLLYFSQKLPAMAGNTPLVVLFYSSSLHLVILSLVVTVVVLNLSRNCYSIPVPWVLQSLLLGWPGRMLGLHHIVLLVPSAEDRHESCSGMEDSSIEASSSGGNVSIGDDSRRVLTRTSSHRRHQVNWILLAIAIDRLCFLLYCLLFIILATVYSV